MSVWMCATAGLAVALPIPAYLACRGTTSQRWIAAQMLSALTILILTLMTFAFDQPSFVDLPLALALLSLPGALLIALFLERWL